MSATGQEKVRQGFGPVLETFKTVPFNNVEQLEASIDEEVGAIMLEVIQGEGESTKLPLNSPKQSLIYVNPREYY